MPQFVFDVDVMGGEAACAKGKGVRRLFIADNDLIDWPAMLADPLKWDPVNEVVLGYTYKAGGGHYETSFDRTNSTFNAEYSRDNGYYEVLTAIQIEGNSPARSKKIKRLLVGCNLHLHLYLANGTQRSLGQDYDGEAFFAPVLKFEIERHLSDAGTFGGDGSRDELDFSGRTEFDPLFANVPVATMLASALAEVTAAYGPNSADNTTAYGPEGGDGTTLYGAVGGPVTPAAMEAPKTNAKSGK